ncbi:MAG: phosphoribosylglycinamide formyltransferase [Hyphomonadaceae bacterium]|nr:phosphoribosylglycinamide formyltransferase [Hyphomonadaceae bacterium]
MKSVGVLISGRGSNLQALLDAQDAPGAYRIVRVISNVEGALGLERARAAGIDALTIPHQGKPREAFERELDAALQGCDLVALAGFMRVLSPWFVTAWSGRVLNIHPSLLPSFPGRDTHERALAAGVKLHGCTVHVVTEALDAGPIIGQAAIPVLRDDTPELLAARLLDAEHLLYPRALAAFAKGEAALLEKPLLSAWT